MSAHNSSAQEVIDSYFALTPKPGYAIAVSGAWGSGKTHLLKSLVRKQENKCCYLSLYGLRTTDEIAQNLFNQLHSVIGHKYTRLTAQVLGKMIGLSIKDIFGETEASGRTIPEVTATSKAPDIGEHFATAETEAVLIFDDIERCAIPIQELLGYINGFVEHGGNRVLLGVNQAEIQEKESFQKFKEKTIGLCVEVEPDFDSAFDEFCDTAAGGSVQNVLASSKQDIHALFDAAKHGNLRILRQLVVRFTNAYSALSTRCQSDQGFTESFINDYFSVGLSCLLTTKTTLNESDSSLIMLPDHTKKQFPDHDAYQKHLTGPYSRDTDVFGELAFRTIDWTDCWKDFFVHGYIHADTSKALEANWWPFIQSEAPTWQRLSRYFFTLENTETIHTQANQLLTQLTDRMLLSLESVLASYSTLFSMHSQGIFDFGDLDIRVQEAKRHLEFLAKDHESVFLGNSYGQHFKAANGIGFITGNDYFDQVIVHARKLSDDLETAAILASTLSVLDQLQVNPRKRCYEDFRNPVFAGQSNRINTWLTHANSREILDWLSAIFVFRLNRRIFEKSEKDFLSDLEKSIQTALSKKVNENEFSIERGMLFCLNRDLACYNNQWENFFAIVKRQEEQN